MGRRQRRPSKTPMNATIENFSHDGRGIARIDGKTTFIHGALPDETVSFQYLLKKKDFDEGRVLEIFEESSKRVKPQCEHYSFCGGCSLQHLAKKYQIEEKEILLLDVLRRTAHIQPEEILPIIESHSWHYRNRARLSVRFHEKKQVIFMGFRERFNPEKITDIKQCLILNEKVNQEWESLRNLIQAMSNPACIAQIEVAVGDDDVALIIRHLKALSLDDEEKIRQFAESSGFRIFLQSAGVRSVRLFYSKGSSEFLHYRLPDQNISFDFHPTDFTQVNPLINRLMVERALLLLALDKTDKVLDLFCGLGNFSLPMAKYCAKVVGVEGSSTMVERAMSNARSNNILNAEFLLANLEKDEELVKLAAMHFDKVLLDPPRAGARAVMKLLEKLQPKCVVYVSCNPATLARDADVLVNQLGYRFKSAGVMDMFPHTAHVESIALFVR